MARGAGRGWRVEGERGGVTSPQRTRHLGEGERVTTTPLNVKVHGPAPAGEKIQDQWTRGVRGEGNGPGSARARATDGPASSAASAGEH
ncbi:hypothetical protein KGM_203500 [Danaus plexippus plexippus]|uniref:Uncharacterized protein n=1 Tax=Danaus plexippus plexippus TaxID=278856 RepID=A0A212EWP0_DANPL|nr:hypothetical protein KGM_203500 [Danaus plexippus plexippus]